jgi:mobilome CxxCx(11)CxxC protein
MIDDDGKKRLLSIRTAAIVDKHLYARRLASVRLRSRAVDFTALATPTLYFALRLTAKGTDAQHDVEICWEFLAATLMVLTLFKLVFKWDENAEKYSRQIAENIQLANKSYDIYVKHATVSQKEYRAFVDEAGRIEKEDRDILGHVRPDEERRAYREALKELDPSGDAICPACGASARRFSPGSCQECGNTPAREVSSARSQIRVKS